MAVLRRFVSFRKFPDPIFQYIAELEDIFVERLCLDSCGIEECIGKDAHYGPDDYDFVMVPMASDIRYFSDNDRVIPWVFDVFPKDFEQFRLDIAKFKIVYLTDTVVCRRLRAMGCGQVRFMPFSVSDAHVADGCLVKDIDIIHYGRRDTVLESYTETLLRQNPHLHYVRTEYDSNRNRHYFHSNFGGMVGSSDVRDNFWKVLERCKVSLVSMPGFDHGRREGLLTVPIRYFESAAKFCHMISRHPDSGDFLWLGISDIAENVRSYEEFELIAMRCLNNALSPQKTRSYSEFLAHHIASRRADQVREDVASL